MPDKKTIASWKYHFQEEVDASFLYNKLSSIENDPVKKNIYKRLSDVEKKHILAWQSLLEENKFKIKNEPSLKAKLLSFLSEHSGKWILTKALMNEEASEVKSYLSLYRESTDKTTKNLAYDLAKDSVQHAGKLMQIKGTTSEPWHRSESGSLLRNIVYGFNDGLTANFGLLAGMIGASQPEHIILISGIAGMLADSLSMGSSGYLAAISEKEVYENEKKMEREEINMMPELEAEELAIIYESKGMDRDEAVLLANEVIKNPEQALQEKLREELGIVENDSSPLKEGWITGTATAVGAFIPIIPFFITSGALAIWLSFSISMLAHFAVGAARSIFTGRGIFRSGIDMFLVGFGVAAVGYILGEIIIKFF